MKPLRFPAALAFALIGSLIAALAAALLTPLLGTLPVARMLISATSLAYVLLIAGSGGRAGRPSALLIWALGASVAWLSGMALIPFLLIHAAVIWLVRGAFGYRGVAAWVVDLAISGVAVTAMLVTLAHTASIGLGIWTFYLVQATAAWVPVRQPAPGSAGARAEHDQRFERAHRSAQAAIRQLLTQ